MISCQCGEVALESSLYHTNLKCSHQLFQCLKHGETLDKISPECPNITLLYHPFMRLTQRLNIIKFNMETEV